jgi:hypothetical protein
MGPMMVVIVVVHDSGKAILDGMHLDVLKSLLRVHSRHFFYKPVWSIFVVIIIVLLFRLRVIASSFRMTVINVRANFDSAL